MMLVVKENGQVSVNQTPKTRSFSINLLTDNKYTLDADMITGWRPSFFRSRTGCVDKAISFNFETPFDTYFKSLIENKDPSVTYVGVRPKDSSIIESLLEKNTFRLDINSFKNDNLLEFNSNFESGNIDFVQKKSPTQYSLWMRSDTNSRHTQWYYFKVINKVKGPFCFSINNFYKSKSAYLHGMKPYVKSKKLSPEQSWQQAGEMISYIQEKDQYKLSFVYDFQYPLDEVEFAYCIPYTYSKLQKHIQTIEEKFPTLVSCSFLYQSSIYNCPILTITNPTPNKKKVIVISARIHPGETNSSIVMKGLIDYLTSKEANFLMENIQFKIIPMLNPEGVIMGNYRSGLHGLDYNRSFNSETQSPIINSLIELARSLKDDLLAYIDLHGHSIKQNCFAYGPKFLTNEVYLQIQDEYYQCRMIPKFLSKRSDIFRYNQCRYQDLSQKENTGRRFIQQLCNLVNSFTIETSFGIYQDKNNKIKNFDKKTFESVGKSIGLALSDYVYLIVSQNALKESLKRFNIQQKQKQSVTLDTKTKYFQKFFKQDLQEQNNMQEGKDSDTEHSDEEQIQQTPKKETSNKSVRIQRISEMNQKFDFQIKQKTNHQYSNTKSIRILSIEKNKRTLSTHFEEQTNPKVKQFQIYDNIQQQEKILQQEQRFIRSKSLIAPYNFPTNLIEKKILLNKIPKELVKLNTLSFQQVIQNFQLNNKFPAKNRLPKYKLQFNQNKALLIRNPIKMDTNN